MRQSMITEKTIKFIEMLNIPGKKAFKFKIKDKLGERTLIIPRCEPQIFNGDPTPGILKIEALTRTRLRNGENPCEFFRIYDQFRKESNPNDKVSFVEFVQRLHPNKIDVLSSELDERAYKNWLAEVGVEGIKDKSEKQPPKLSAVMRAFESSLEDPELTDTESFILEALGSDTLRGPELLKKAGYDNSSHYRTILSNLVKRKILGRNSKGYYAL